MPDVADISLRKLPPYNEEAEQYVLGACFGSGDAFARALEFIERDDFHRSVFYDPHRFFKAVVEDTEPADLKRRIVSSLSTPQKVTTCGFRVRKN